MSIQDYFNQEFNWSSTVSVDEFGDHKIANSKTIKGRIQLKKVLLKTEASETVLADGILYTDSIHNIKNHDVIHYIDSTEIEKRFEVVEIYEAYNKDNIHHKKVLLKYSIV